MSQFIFVLRVSTTPLSAEQTEQRTSQWGALIRQLMVDGKLVDSHVFEKEGFTVSGTPDRTILKNPVIDHDSTVGGVLIIQANDLDEAIEISKRCPTIDFGGSVEVRPLQPRHNRA